MIDQYKKNILIDILKKIFCKDRGLLSFVTPETQKHIYVFAGFYVEWKRLCEPLNIFLIEFVKNDFVFKLIGICSEQRTNFLSFWI